MLSYPLQEFYTWNGNPRSRAMKLRMRIRGLMSIVLLTVICMPGGARGGNIDHVPVASVIDRPDSLESAWGDAIASAHRLKSSHKSAEAAHESVSAAKAARLPTVTAEGGYFWLDDAPSAIVSLPGLPDLSMAMDDQFFAGRVTAAVPLYTSGRISNSVKAAEAGWKATQAEERLEKLDLKLNVADAYVKVLRATQAVQIATSSVTRLTSHSRNVVNLFAKGFVAKTDLLASQVVLADARQREIQAHNSLDLASASYNRLLVRPLTQAVRLEDLEPPPASNTVDELTERALQERPELTAFSEQTEALHQEAGSVRASALPSVGVSSSYLHLENSVLERDHVWTVGLVGTWNIFDSGLTRHKAQAVDDKADAVSALLAEATDVVSLQVRQFWLEVAETRLRLGVTTDAVAQAEENLKVAQDRYHTGTGTSTEVLDAETLRVLSLGNHNNAVYDAVMASFRLRRAVGDL